MSEQRLKRGPSRGFWIVLLVSLGALSVWFLTRPCNAFKQRANMEKAAAHTAKIAPSLSKDPRFTQVTVGEFTGGACGCMFVSGVVENDADMAALKEIIVATQPPMEVLYRVIADEE